MLSSPFSMAPMAGVTDVAFRARLRRWGCRALTTEMVSAAALARGNRKTLAYLDAPDRGDDLAVQLFGADPRELAEAAEVVQEFGFHSVDLNMGCPVRKVVRSGAGAALLRDLERAERCLVALRKAVTGTLSVKIRSGWDAESVNFLATGRMAADCGADWVTLHPRTRAQGYSGAADWSQVETLARALSVPVVGNGDVGCAEQAVARLRRSGSSGVMIGRAALARPWIFREAQALWAGRVPDEPPTQAEIGQDLLRQMADLRRWKGERVAAFEMQKFLAWAARGVPGASEFRRKTQACACVGSLEMEIRRFFGVGRDRAGGQDTREREDEGWRDRALLMNRSL